MAARKSDIASIIWELRQDRGWTMAELARRLDVSEATVSRWESGKSMPKSENLRALAVLMDVDPGRFVERTLRDLNSTELSRRILEARVTMSEETQEVVEVGDHEIALLSDGSLVVNGLVHILPSTRTERRE